MNLKIFSHNYTMDLSLETMRNQFPKIDETIELIQNSFLHLESFRQYPVLCGDKQYRIDLYFSDLKIAVECVEKGRIDYKRDNIRHNDIFKKLRCSWVRFDYGNQRHLGHAINHIVKQLNRKEDIEVNL